MKMNAKSMIAFLDDEELHAIVMKMAESPDTTYEGISPKDIVPFIESEDVEVLMASLAKNGLDFSFLYPFADEEGIAKALKEAIANGHEVDLKKALPFMDEEDIDKIVLNLVNDGKITEIKPYLPFLSDDGYTNIFFSLLDKKEYGKANALLPLLPDEVFHRLVDETLDGKHGDYDFSTAYPFMDEKDIKRLFLYALKNKNNGDLQ